MLNEKKETKMLNVNNDSNSSNDYKNKNIDNIEDRFCSSVGSQ